MFPLAVFSAKHGTSEGSCIRDTVQTSQRSATEVCSVSYNRITTAGTVTSFDLFKDCFHVKLSLLYLFSYKTGFISSKTIPKV